MIEKVVIANRGEIALRIIRACRELRVKSIALFSDADANSLHARYADEAYLLGPSPPSESYLNIPRIMEITLASGADAVHPGYGFLSEDPNFAAECEKKNIIFVGPNSHTLELTGNKFQCRVVLEKNGLPIVPGSSRVINNESEALDIAENVGWPILIKAVYGGGGRGIRVASSQKELEGIFDTAMKEAEDAFGRHGLYIEKFYHPIRHIEFQILADRGGNTVHLGERECSIQRRYQKLLEFSPSPIISSKLRGTIGALVINGAKALGYTNAGTFEFIVDKNGGFHFIEVNARLQVEHPVTELVVGIDLVKQQFRIADGQELGFSQEEIRMNGSAIECRITAEDVFQEFAPSTGTIMHLHNPDGPWVRVDTALYSGYEIPIYYDSLLAKLIVWGHTFEEARLRMLRALDEYVVEGVETTIPLHKILLNDNEFAKGHLSTDFIQRRRLVNQALQAKEKRAGNLDETAAILLAVRANSGIRKQTSQNRISQSSGMRYWRDRGADTKVPRRKGWFADGI